MAGIDRRDCGPDLTLSLATGAGGADSLPKSDAAAKQQAMTIFYEGRVRVFHATETQAKAIISMAKRGMEEETSKTTRKESVDSSTLSQPLPPPPPPPPPVLQSGLSMKRSLLRFLQKRKARIHEAAPYIREDKFMPLLPIKLQQV